MGCSQGGLRFVCTWSPLLVMDVCLTRGDPDEPATGGHSTGSGHQNSCPWALHPLKRLTGVLCTEGARVSFAFAACPVALP